MAKSFYYLRYIVDGKKARPQMFTDRTEAFDSAKALIVKYAKRLFDIDSYICAIRKGVNIKYRAMVADYLDALFASEKFVPRENEFPHMYEADGYLEELYTWEDMRNEDWEPPTDPLSEFSICQGNGIEEFDFFIREKLSVKIDIPADYEVDDFGEMLVLMKDSKHEVKVSVKCKTIEWYLEKPSNSANILLVYKSLTRYPQTREAIRKTISRLSNAKISIKTIGKQIDILRKIGVPIAYKGLNRYMRENNETEIGFYMDIAAASTKADLEALSELGTRVNPMLVLHTLEENRGRALRQAEIIEIIEHKYGVKIARAAVGRHIKMLTQLEYDIEKTGAGFLLNNA